MKRCLVFFSLLLAGPAWGQSITVPATVQIGQPGFVIIRATAMDADAVAWYSIGPGLQSLPPDVIAPKAGVYVGFTLSQGTYKIGVIAAKSVMGKAVLTVPQEITVNVGPPVPPPPPPPVPGQFTVTGYSSASVASGTTFSVTGSAFAAGITATWNGQPIPLTVASPTSLNATAPAVTATATVPVVFSLGGATVTGPPLTVTAGGPVPIPVAGFRVLILYDSATVTKMPPAQQLVLYSTDIRTWLNSKCAVGADGKTKEWRIWDPGTDVTAESQVWQDAMKLKHDSLPWVVVSNGKTGFSGPLPANVADAMTLFKKYAE